MSRKKLKEKIKKDKQNYDFGVSRIKSFYAWICHDRDYYVWKYIKMMRYTEYYFNEKKHNKWCWIKYVFYKHRKNKLGLQIGLDFGEGVFDEGLYIAHTGIIVGSAKVGKNCRLHGQNCIGSGAEIGDNCELWVGAKVFGPSKLANNITVAAGSVVISSFSEEGITIAGVPAKKVG